MLAEHKPVRRGREMIDLLGGGAEAQAGEDTGAAVRRQRQLFNRGRLVRP
jgi:hypothetical protein